jgi:hypothetical protein
MTCNFFMLCPKKFNYVRILPFIYKQENFMKSILVLALVLASTIVSAKEPVCANVGSRSEGWKVDGKLLWDKCSEKVAVCENEGWISYGKLSEKLLGWDSECKASNKPRCANIGSKSEGWMINGKLNWANCSDKVVICGAKGSRSQGWYAVELDKASAHVISTEQCKK